MGGIVSRVAPACQVSRVSRRSARLTGFGADMTEGIASELEAVRHASLGKIGGQPRWNVSMGLLFTRCRICKACVEHHWCGQRLWCGDGVWTSNTSSLTARNNTFPTSVPPASSATSATTCQDPGSPIPDACCLRSKSPVASRVLTARVPGGIALAGRAWRGPIVRWILYVAHHDAWLHRACN